MYVCAGGVDGPLAVSTFNGSIGASKWGVRILGKKGMGGKIILGLNRTRILPDHTNSSFGGYDRLHQAATQRGALEQFYMPS